jgi:predicted alpha/beta-hydrolase family hydrolase
MGTATICSIDQDQCEPTMQPLELLWNAPFGEIQATLLLAHGAGAPMDSDFLQQISSRLAANGMAVVRFEFPYMAARRLDGRRRPPNPKAQLLACWRQVVAQVRGQTRGPLLIGGKSMGGRMASLLADELKVDGVVCLGYPFHAIGKPENPRVEHLAHLQTPTLIIQGERDPMGRRETVASYSLSVAIRLYWLPAADHDLKPLKVSGFNHAGHLDQAAAAVHEFLQEICASRL